jgi:signal transduction histidine kinase
VWAASIVYTAYVFLCFPAGQLESALERWFIRVYWLSTAVVWTLILALAPTLPPGGSFVNCGTQCPGNALQIVDGHASTGAVLSTIFQIIFTVALIGVATLIVSKARSAAEVRRRAMVPLAVAFLADIVEFAIALFVLPSYPATAGALKVADGVVTLAVPVAVLVGQIRSDRFAARNLGQIAIGASGERMSRAAVQTMIADALGDPTLQLALWERSRGGYRDVWGAPVEIPYPGPARGVTHVTRNDQPVAALIHDPALDADSDLVVGLAATSLMLLENTRLVEELRASRTRIVNATERERKRLESDLHDGAQQWLVMIQAHLGLARELAERDDVQAQLQIAQEHAETALHALRALSYSVYPTALRDYGVAAAVRDLASAAPVPVRVVDSGIGRLPEETEAAIYFCAREAIHNVAQHTGPGAAATVTLRSGEDAVELWVRDNGVDIRADRPTTGIGIIDARDRIEAVGGRLDIASASAEGTSVHATIPKNKDRPPSADSDRSPHTCAASPPI